MKEKTRKLDDSTVYKYSNYEQKDKEGLMMDVREKLVELLLQEDDVCEPSECKDCGVNGSCYYHRTADKMIAHGVTVQERGYWVSLTDCANAGVYCSVCHKKVYKEDYARCNRKNKLHSDYCPHCGSKMIPEPPKGE